MKKKRIQMNHQGFTLLEMLVVLLIISVLILLFVPNLSKHKEGVDKKGNEAIVKIVETQLDLYTMENNQVPTLEQLLKEKYITQDQYDKYQASQK
ncbi:competence type IV pilus major pilin ComGC [Candidatus Enterococcus mansonii]|uniref:competence type IV pilus major pilin ComGC n=1 Tax=Candidatus Enterococcus mansonii TaxID=1834181 RepID=UPI000A34D799|nr:competence type IV pilus major pilin ComGC [Enterococcus sp. 4G2_DIV0659]